jgi:type IV pilus assembly protein PilA
MKLEFQAKFLQHLNRKNKQDEGFTLIELLVVIIIIGILAAIALPSLLAQVNKGKQAEGKQNIGTINRTQQAYFLENDSFTSEVTTLGVGIKTQTVNYKYTIITGSDLPNGGFGAANNRAEALGATLKSYLGQNFTQQTTGVDNPGSEVLTLAFVCETIPVGPTGATAVTGAPVAATGATGCDQTTFKDLSGSGKKQ